MPESRMTMSEDDRLKKKHARAQEECLAALQRWKTNDLTMEDDAIREAAQWVKSQPIFDRNLYIETLMNTDQDFGNMVFAALPNLELEHLHLTYNSELKTIPDGLQIEGELILSVCPGIVSFPAALVVGDLRIWGCRNWNKIIPDDARIDSHTMEWENERWTLESWRTTVNAIAHFRNLAADFEVSEGPAKAAAMAEGVALLGESLNCKQGLVNQQALEFLLEASPAFGNLIFKACPNLTFPGSLNLGFCTTPISLPDGLTVGVDLDLSGCAGWDWVIPVKISIGRWILVQVDGGARELTLLDLRRLARIRDESRTWLEAWRNGDDLAPGKAIEAAMKQTKSRYSMYDRNLEQLTIWALFSLDPAFGNKAFQDCPPYAMEDGEDLDLSCFESLTGLPEYMPIMSSLNLRGCPSLKALPRDLEVMGTLDLFGCTALEALPDGLQVGRHLDMGYCTALRTIGAGLSVGRIGQVSFEGCERWDGKIPDDAILPTAIRQITRHPLRRFIRLREAWLWGLQFVCPFALSFSLSGWFRYPAFCFWGVGLNGLWWGISREEPKVQRFHCFLMGQFLLLSGILLGSGTAALSGTKPGYNPLLIIGGFWLMYLFILALKLLLDLYDRHRQVQA